MRSVIRKCYVSVIRECYTECYKGGRGNFVSGAMSYYARKKIFAWGIG